MAVETVGGLVSIRIPHMMKLLWQRPTMILVIGLRAGTSTVACTIWRACLLATDVVGITGAAKMAATVTRAVPGHLSQTRCHTMVAWNPFRRQQRLQNRCLKRQTPQKQSGKQAIAQIKIHPNRRVTVKSSPVHDGRGSPNWQLRVAPD